MFRSTTTLAIVLLLAAWPALAQSTKDAASSEGVSVAFAPGVMIGLPGPGVTVTNPPNLRDLRVRAPLAIDVPGPAVPLTPLDFGGYEPYVPRLARQVLPDTPNDTDPFQITLSGTPTRTTIGTKVQARAGNATVKARATSTIPGLPVLGDKASKWRPAPDLKVDVSYRF